MGFGAIEKLKPKAGPLVLVFQRTTGVNIAAHTLPRIQGCGNGRCVARLVQRRPQKHADTDNSPYIYLHCAAKASRATYIPTRPLNVAPAMPIEADEQETRVANPSCYEAVH